jgi:hypothetical protein
MVDKIFELGARKGVPGIPSDLVDKDYPLGRYLCVGPTELPGVEETQNRYSNLNFTGPPGTASEIYFNLVYMLPKLEWFVQKADEWIEVSPTHKEYYERTMTTKQMLESTIKTGLVSAAQSVADFELLSHDIRKYKEILGYFQSKDENLLRSMFVDQVDVHTDLPGQPIALRTIVSRWPTIIADFMRLKDDDTDPNKFWKTLDISKAEAVILATKNKLYVQWKRLFGDAAKERYEMLKGLVKSREKSITEYKEWLKPYIARFKMTKLAGERALTRAETLRTFADVTGMSTFANRIRLFAWKPMKFAEHRKPAAEVMGHFILYPYDDYIRENLVLNTKTGLAAIYPWLTHPRKYCSKCDKFYSEKTVQCNECKSTRLEDKTYADELVEDNETGIIPAWKRREFGLDPRELYYMFLDFNIFRTGTRLQVGEIEDIIFYTKIFVLSQNAMLVKILELKCRDLELERYIDEMLGIRFDEKDISELVKEEFPELFGKPEELSEAQQYMKGLRESFESYTGVLKGIKTPKAGNLIFFKQGPYERDLKDRITKHYCKYAALHLGVVSQFLKQKMGVE